MAFSVPPPHPAAAAAAAGAVSSSAGARTQTIDRIIGSRRDALAAGFRGRGRPARAVWSAGGRQTTSFAFRVQCSASNRGAEVSVSNLGYLFPNDATALTNGSSNAGSSGLSARGRSLKPLTKVMERVQPIVEAVQKNPYDASSNPGGVIDMGLAQSRLAWDLLKEGVSGPRGLTTLHAYYGPYRGLASFRASLAPFLETFLGAAVRPDDLILAPGTTGAIDALANVLFDAGDAILLAAPYYYYFDVDLSYRAQLRLVPVKTDPSSGFAWRPEDFEATLEAAEAAGLRVKGILVCNPDNPLGRTVTREQLSGLMDLCVRRGLHLISDEVYANNVHGAAGGEFVSAWEVAAGSPAEQRVHVAWGFSKDFGLSGYRVGVAASRNGAAVEAMSTLSRFSGVSSDTQATLGPLVADVGHALRFLRTHQTRLLEAYDQVQELLEELGVPYVPASAGPFVWARLAPHAQTFEEEQAFLGALAAEGVYVMPGSMFHCPRSASFSPTGTPPSPRASAGLVASSAPQRLS